MPEQDGRTARAGVTRRTFIRAAAVAVAGTAVGAMGGATGCGSAGRVRPLDPVGPAGGAWSFRSRPDLHPPVVTVARWSEKTGPGHIFIAPKNGPGETGPGQRGPLILDDDGQPIWFRPLSDEAEDAMDFKMQRLRGEPVLTWWQGPHTAYGRGEYAVLDGSYEELTRVRAGNGYQADLHELLITGQDTALIIIYGAVPQDLSSVSGPEDGMVAEGVVQEIDIESGEVLFEWRSLEHVPVEESYFPPPGDPAEPFDYLHANSIEVDLDGNLIVSARKTSAAYKIDRQSGEVLWRLDGKRSDFEMGPGTLSLYQHDARRRSDGMLTIFDNGDERSRAVAVELDEASMTARLVREYTHPEGRLSATQGNMQNLPNSNTFVGWGSEPGFSEFGPEAELVFDAGLPSGVESYRAFRFPWVGRPRTDPAVAVEPGPAPGEISVHASWNGATEVAAWAVFAGPSPDRLRTLGSVARAGFETAMAARTEDHHVGVVALDGRGHELGRSAVVRPGEQTSGRDPGRRPYGPGDQHRIV